MRRSSCFLLVVLSATAITARTVAGQAPADSAAITRVIAGYIDGWRRADTVLLGRVFSPHGVIVWPADDGGVSTITFAEVLRHRRPQPGYGEPWRVLSLAMNDEVAVARVAIATATVDYLDVLTLYRLEDGWRIVCKAYSVRRR